MIVVVADASPINYLVQIGAVEVLAHFFDEIVIPKTVWEELLHPATPESVREWVSHLPNWVTIRKGLDILPLNLDPGETEAIAIAKEIGAFAVLLDDSEARQSAKRGGCSDWHDRDSGASGGIKPARFINNLSKASSDFLFRFTGAVAGGARQGRGAKARETLRRSRPFSRPQPCSPRGTPVI
jgi:hypothetical protein